MPPANVREQVERHLKKNLGLETIDVVTGDTPSVIALKGRLGELLNKLDDSDLREDFEMTFEPNTAGSQTLVLSREGKSLAILGLQPEGSIRDADPKYTERYLRRVDTALSMLEAVRFGQGKQTEGQKEYYFS